MDLLQGVYDGESDEKSSQSPPPRKKATQSGAAEQEQAGDARARSPLPQPGSLLSAPTRGRKRRRQYTVSGTSHRARVFPHQEGRWPTSVFIPVLLRADLARCAEEAVQEAESVAGRPLPIEFDVEEPPGEAGAVAATGRGRLQQWEEPWVRRVLRGRGSAERRRGEGHLPHLHLSLSRPCALEGADISAFAGAVGAALRGCARFTASTGPLRIFTNDNSTRQFAALETVLGADRVLDLIARVDSVMRRFGQPAYYEDPVPHVSVASWVLGAGDAPVEEAGKSSGAEEVNGDPFGLRRLASRATEADTGPESALLRCEEVHCKVGNRLYRFPLAPET